MSYNAKFEEIVKNENVPHPPASVANYIATRRVGDVVYVSGQAPFKGDDIAYTGKLGDTVSLNEGVASARLTGLNLLYNVQDELGTLDNVDFIIGIEGMVNCTPDFTDQSKVVDGCSDMLVEIFGDVAGKHTRAATGHVALAFDISTEISMMVKVKNEQGN